MLFSSNIYMVHCGLYPSHGALIKTCLKELIKEVCLLRVLGHGTLAWVESPPVLPLGCVIWINCLLEIPFFFPVVALEMARPN